ncbi:MAG TPA: beta-ketoacyl synthase N-terminal-like domain-containing protein, partial [Myxococcota bacterium]|nr:beta-ketoacyl synthase N-terminal-like domain-containing protein [Myxococcota bacterium]
MSRSEEEVEDTSRRAIAIVGVGAILPDAPDAPTFWTNVTSGRYSISEVPFDRWDPTFYYNPDPHAPDKTYCKIGSWVQKWPWDPVAWRLPIPPRVADAMDDAQKWTIACVREALTDYGHPTRSLDLARTAVVLGNAMAGEKHYLTSLRVFYPEFAEALAHAPSFAALSGPIRDAIVRESRDALGRRLPSISEDTMPGELANCLAGRVANLLDLHGPNFVTDAACASALAAISASAEGLLDEEYDAVLAGGIDRNMGPSTFVKFCKIGALSASGTRPYAKGADGFVMGEGAVVFLLKRLADAEKSGDKVYAVLRGIGGSSDGRGKGLTAPNPVGQKYAIERAWRSAGLSPATATLFEGHGTSTRVGDVVEVQSLTEVLSARGAKPRTIALGSVKSNIGHLKGAAGAAGLLKTVLALHEKVIPPSLNFEQPNPDIDFEHSPLVVNTVLRPWDETVEGVRRAGVSAFGFGGTNFHAVLEEYVPGRLAHNRRSSVAVSEAVVSTGVTPAAAHRDSAEASGIAGVAVLGAADESGLAARLEELRRLTAAGQTPSAGAPAQSSLRAPLRLAVQYASALDLAQKTERAAKALAGGLPAAWSALRAQGVHRGEGPPPKVCFLYTGQGSQYVNMLRDLRDSAPEVTETFAEADRVMEPLLGHPLSEFIFVDPADARAVTEAEEALRRTEVTQPAVLATDIALTRLLARYGVAPDFVMGHSLGEYAALVAAGALPFEDALFAVSARGRAMASLSVPDNGWMAAVFAPLSEIERVLRDLGSSVELANLNSHHQSVIGGESAAVERAIASFREAGIDAVRLPVSHAFHTRIVAPASVPLRETLASLRLTPPRLPIVSNVTGTFYPTEADAVPEMLELLSRQVASPVQFVKGLETLYSEGARLFVEVGPKKALHGFAEDVLGGRAGVHALFTNHPKQGDEVSFQQALAGIYASGHGLAAHEAKDAAAPHSAPEVEMRGGGGDRYTQLGHLFAEFLDRGMALYRGSTSPASDIRVMITGAALGLPGSEHVFDDGNVARLLRGEQGIDVIPTRLRHAILEKHITRLVKRPEGTPSLDLIDDPKDVIRLAARAGQFDLQAEFGVPADRLPALDITTRLAIAAGLDALRDAGIPLVRLYRRTTRGSYLPAGWGLPEALRDDTGIIFAAAFPGLDSFADELARYHCDRSRREEIVILEGVRDRAVEAADGRDLLVSEVDRRLHDLRTMIAAEPYGFDRRFLFRVLAMGHSQLAELIGARGPNTHVNAACASTTQAVSLAEDWIRGGRCQRVLIVAADDVTSDHLLEWMGAGFLATGAAATDDVVEEAALPFDRRRHGMILGMGAAALVLETEASAHERGLTPIGELLAAETANSAFHGTRLDVDHIGEVMERLLAKAEARFGINRRTIAPQTVFVSHETYTPARGGSAAAEVEALHRVFGQAAEQIVVANTKGFTGHPMGAGIEDVLAVKSLETGLVPPVANFREPDPELGTLHLSKGGSYPIEYALRLGAGFGSQISMTLVRRVPSPSGHRPPPDELGYAHRIADPAAFLAWLERVSGHPGPELEIIQRTLRVKDLGPPQIATDATRTPRRSERSSAPVPAATRAANTLPPALAPAHVGPGSSPDAAIAPQRDRSPEKVDSVRERVLALVAEKTGYPTDMLALDLDLEADLGIDTVKQAEVFATIREAYGIPRD